MSSRRTYCYINGRVGAVVEHWSLTSLLLLGAAATSSPLLVDVRWKKNVKPYPNIFSSLTQDIIIMSLTSCRWRETPHARQLVMDQPHSTFTCPLLPLSDFSPHSRPLSRHHLLLPPVKRSLPYFPLIHARRRLLYLARRTSRFQPQPKFRC